MYIISVIIISLLAFASRHGPGIEAGKAGVCPHDPNHLGCQQATPDQPTCTGDYTCPGDQKCCFRYCDYQCVLPGKPGRCPDIIQGPCPNPTMISSYCSHDNDCKGNLKCCFYECAFYCVDRGD